MKKPIQLALLLVTMLLLFAEPVFASHFRFGSLTWQPTAVSGEVKLNLTMGARRSFYGSPVTGDTISAIGLDFGDATTSVTPNFRVTAYSATEDWVIAEALDPNTGTAGVLHTYATAGPFTASAQSCCRLSTLNNRADGNFWLQTSVYPFSGNSSPVSSLVPIVTVPSSSTASFFVPASDPNGDTIRWRLSTDAEAGGGSPPTNIGVNPNTGEVTWNNTGLNQSSFWTVQVIIEDLDGIGNVKSRTPVDFLLKINPGVSGNTTPACTLNPSGSLSVSSGTPVSFTVTGTDTDSGDIVTLNTGGLPSGSSMTPALPVSGSSGISSTFNWTPTAGQAGTYQVVFSATDSSGAQSLASKTITVLAGPVITTQLQSQTIVSGGSASFSVTASGANPLTYQWRKDGVNISSATSSTLSLTGINAGSAGNYDVVVSNTYGSVTSSIAKLEIIPGVEWQADFGGTLEDALQMVRPLTDGYILGGFSFSGATGNKTSPSFGGPIDYWLVRLGTGGNKLWETNFGGTGDDLCYATLPTSDGGFIMGGMSASPASGNKSASNFGSHDYWVVRTDAMGNKLWDKSFGGSGYDEFRAIQITADGGIILGGTSDSPVSGNKTNSTLGGYDFWIVRLDANGNKLWEKELGGSGNDVLYGIQETTNGGFFVFGHSGSAGGTGNKSAANIGGIDYWLVKLDANGNKLWDQSYGGTGAEDSTSLELTSDGGCLLGGQSQSGISGSKTAPGYGMWDYWVVKVDANGNQEWDKSFGGTTDEILNDVQQTWDGGYILGGYSQSGINGNKTEANLGNHDYWIVKLDSTGNKLWERAYGGSHFDFLFSLQETPDRGYVLAGKSLSGISGNKTNVAL